MAKVLTFGTFDIVHKGHEYYLQKAKKFGNELIVIIARDKNVLLERGKLPLNHETKRKEHVELLNIADKVMLGYEDNRLRIIQELKPDIICLGYDQNSLSVEKFIVDNNLDIKIVRIDAFKPEIFKSSKFKIIGSM